MILKNLTDHRRFQETLRAPIWKKEKRNFHTNFEKIKKNLLDECDTVLSKFWRFSRSL